MRLLYILVSIIVCLMVVLAIMIFNIPKHIEMSITEPTTISTTIQETTIPETSISETETTIHTEPTEVTEVTEATEITVPETTEATLLYDEEELDMLACTIYREAGGDYYCDECRRRVADVVLNRIADDRYPDTMYEVLTQRSQYGRFHWTGIVWPDRASDLTELYAVERAYRIAEEVLLGNHSELYGQGYIYQAEFKQGKDNIHCCGHYFGR